MKLLVTHGGVSNHRLAVSSVRRKTEPATGGERWRRDSPGERVPLDPLQHLTDQAKGLLLTSSVSSDPCAIAAVEISRLDPQFVEEGLTGSP